MAETAEGRGKSLSPLIALLTCQVAGTFQIAMLIMIMAPLHRAFTDPLGVAWILTTCLLTQAASAAIGGALGDLFGRRRVLVIALMIVTAGAVTCSLSPSLWGLILGAALQGVSGCVTPLCLSLARERMPANRLQQSVGYIMAAATIGSAGAIASSGLLVEPIGWRATYVAAAVLAVMGILALLAFVPASRELQVRGAQKTIWRGAIFAPGIAGLLLGVTNASVWGWTDLRTVIAIVGSIIVLVIWAHGQLRTERPLIDLRLLKDRRLTFAYLCMALTGAGALQHTLVMALFLNQPVATAVGLGLGAVATSLLLLPIRLVGVATSPISGWLSAGYGARTVVILGCALATVGWLIIALFHGTAWLVVLGMFLEGSSSGIIIVGVSNIVLVFAPANRAGEATGILGVLRNTFNAIGAQVTGTLLAAASIKLPGATTTYPAENAYMFAFSYIALISLTSLIVAILIPRDRVTLDRDQDGPRQRGPQTHPMSATNIVRQVMRPVEK